jgi:hypothetical protein
MVVIWYHYWYHIDVTNLSVKNVSSATLASLTRKAALEGTSVQEYVRRLLDRDARCLSPVEIIERQQAARRDALAFDEVDALLGTVTKSQSASARRVAPGAA